MCPKQIITLLLDKLAASQVLAQGGAASLPDPCTIEPVSHCAETMDDGSAIGHFGYRMSCPESDKPFDDAFVPIGDGNYFDPEPVDRGQPTIFAQGEHMDEFEAGFTSEKVKKGSGYRFEVWSPGRLHEDERCLPGLRQTALLTAV